MEKRNNDELLRRIKEAKKRYNLSHAKIAAAAGLAASTVTNQLCGHYKLDIDVVSAVLELCPDLSSEWLLRGKGNMTDKADLELLIARVDALEKRVGV